MGCGVSHSNVVHPLVPKKGFHEVPTREIVPQTEEEILDNVRSLYTAILANDFERVKFLVENKRTPLQFRFKEQTHLPIHIACRKGNLQVIRYLIDKGANPNEIDLEGRNSLHFAAEGGNADTVAFLYHKQQVKYLRDFKGRSPLDCVKEWDYDTAKELAGHFPLVTWEDTDHSLYMGFPEGWQQTPDLKNHLLLVKFTPVVDTAIVQLEPTRMELKIIREDTSKYTDDLNLDKYVEIFKRSLSQVPNVIAEFLEENEEKLQVIPLPSEKQKQQQQQTNNQPQEKQQQIESISATMISNNNTGNTPRNHENTNGNQSNNHTNSTSNTSQNNPPAHLTHNRNSSNGNIGTGTPNSNSATVSTAMKAKSLVIRLDIPTELNTISLKVVNFFVLYNKRAYIITYSGDVSEWTKGHLLARRCISSLRFLDKNNSLSNTNMIIKNKIPDSPAL